MIRYKQPDTNESWNLGGHNSKFFIDNGKKVTNPDHDMLARNGYEAEVISEPIESEPIIIPATNESKWRTYMNSISWNRDLTWGAPK